MDIKTEVKALPELPVVIARDMIYAQAWSPNAEERQAIQARSDFFERHGLDRTVHIQVRDEHGLRIGSLKFFQV